MNIVRVTLRVLPCLFLISTSVSGSAALPRSNWVLQSIASEYSSGGLSSSLRSVAAGGSVASTMRHLLGQFDPTSKVVRARAGEWQVASVWQDGQLHSLQLRTAPHGGVIGYWQTNHKPSASTAPAASAAKPQLPHWLPHRSGRWQMSGVDHQTAYVVSAGWSRLRLDASYQQLSKRAIAAGCTVPPQAVSLQGRRGRFFMCRWQGAEIVATFSRRPNATGTGVVVYQTRSVR